MSVIDLITWGGEAARFYPAMALQKIDAFGLDTAGSICLISKFLSLFRGQEKMSRHTRGLVSITDHPIVIHQMTTAQASY